MAKKVNRDAENYYYLKSGNVPIEFGYNGQIGEASDATEPIFKTFETLNLNELPFRISKSFRKQMESVITQLKRVGLKRVVRISFAEFTTLQSDGKPGFTRWVDGSREWRECQLSATLLEQYIDIYTGECVIEYFDNNALITIRQSRHINASHNKKKKEIYVRENYNCPSCGAELKHIADQTNCEYCGAVISFNFFDWQLDSFYIDMRKETLLQNMQEVAMSAADTTLKGAAKTTSFVVSAVAEGMDRADLEAGIKGHDNQFGAAICVFAIIVLIIFFGFFALPRPIRIAILATIVGLIAWRVAKYQKATNQQRKKKRIVRYSDAYLRSCIYDEIWKDIDTSMLIDFSVDGIEIGKVKNTEENTSIDISVTTIMKYIDDERRLRLDTQDARMSFTRARYPDAIENNGTLLYEKECPSCGSNFEPDKKNCCSYCGYGLKIDNYVWKRIS